MAKEIEKMLKNSTLTELSTERLHNALEGKYVDVPASEETVMFCYLFLEELAKRTKRNPSTIDGLHDGGVLIYWSDEDGCYTDDSDGDSWVSVEMSFFLRVKNDHTVEFSPNHYVTSEDKERIYVMRRDEIYFSYDRYTRDNLIQAIFYDMDSNNWFKDPKEYLSEDY